LDSIGSLDLEKFFFLSIFFFLKKNVFETTTTKILQTSQPTNQQTTDQSTKTNQLKPITQRLLNQPPKQKPKVPTHNNKKKS